VGVAPFRRASSRAEEKNFGLGIERVGCAGRDLELGTSEA